MADRKGTGTIPDQVSIVISWQGDEAVREHGDRLDVQAGFESLGICSRLGNIVSASVNHISTILTKWQYQLKARTVCH
jgi:hypothetical protein